MTSLANIGLRIELLREHDYTMWRRWPFVERGGDGTYHKPRGMPSLPLMYSLLATKTA